MESKKKNVLKAYFRWPFYLGVLPVLGSIAGLFFDKKFALFSACFAVLYFLIFLIVYFTGRKRVLNRLVEFGASYAQVQGQLLRRIEIPFLMCNTSKEILWRNPAFIALFEEKKKETSLIRLFPELENTELKSKTDIHVTYGARHYLLRAFPLNQAQMPELAELDDDGKTGLFNLYLLDETELLESQRLLSEEKPVVGLVYFDNYEEVMAQVEDVRRSLLSALAERKLNKYFSSVDGIVRKLEKDRFLVVLNQKALWTLMEDNFSLLEDVKTVNIGNEMALTVSMGIGVGGDSIRKNYEFAGTAIDNALGRGGDQAVIKENTEMKYYGGKAKTTEKSTRVKSRIKAQALKGLVESADSVLIMGHPISDLDCLGAAMGIYRMARFTGRPVHIVLGEISNSVRPLMKLFRENASYEEDLFVTRENAQNYLTRDTLLVVADTNRPSYTECPELLNRASCIVVLDHHRQGKEQIENATLSYVEPYASSASEMVSEIVQYYDENIKLSSREADALLAGIVMDTNNFEDKAGVRTFEAAAYLRRSGADVTRVRKLFRDSMQDYKLRAETVSKAELFEKDYIISVCPNTGSSENQTVVAAQAANELLEIDGVKASFVLTSYEDKIYLSARSIDEVNVQVLMEKLGGGGHQSVAGAQFTGITVDEAVDLLKKAITEQEGVQS